MIKSRTFIEIRRIVIERGLNRSGFMQHDIIPYLSEHIKSNTVGTFVWKHAIGGGNVPNLYFEKSNTNLYRIRREYL